MLRNFRPPTLISNSGTWKQWSWILWTLADIYEGFQHSSGTKLHMTHLCWSQMCWSWCINKRIVSIVLKLCCISEFETLPSFLCCECVSNFYVEAKCVGRWGTWLLLSVALLGSLTAINRVFQPYHFPSFVICIVSFWVYKMNKSHPSFLQTLIPTLITKCFNPTYSCCCGGGGGGGAIFVFGFEALEKPHKHKI